MSSSKSMSAGAPSYSIAASNLPSPPNAPTPQTSVNASTSSGKSNLSTTGVVLIAALVPFAGNAHFQSTQKTFIDAQKHKYCSCKCQSMWQTDRQTIISIVDCTVRVFKFITLCKWFCKLSVVIKVIAVAPLSITLSHSNDEAAIRSTYNSFTN